MTRNPMSRSNPPLWSTAQIAAVRPVFRSAGSVHGFLAASERLVLATVTQSPCQL